jgi:hypothetical protein
VARQFWTRTAAEFGTHDPRWDVFVLMEVADVLEDFLVFNRLGAHLSLPLIHQRADELFLGASRRC